MAGTRPGCGGRGPDCGPGDRAPVADGVRGIARGPGGSADPAAGRWSRRAGASPGPSRSAGARGGTLTGGVRYSPRRRGGRDRAAGPGGRRTGQGSAPAAGSARRPRAVCGGGAGPHAVRPASRGVRHGPAGGGVGPHPGRNYKTRAVFLARRPPWRAVVEDALTSRDLSAFRLALWPAAQLRIPPVSASGPACSRHSRRHCRGRPRRAPGRTRSQDPRRDGTTARHLEP